MPWLLLPTIHDPKTSIRSIGPRRFAGTSRDAIFFPRLKTHIPPGDPGWKFPQAAKTLSCQENVAVIIPGVWGRLTKTRFRPRRTSYVCKEYPTEVVIWNVDFPRRTHASGTAVGDTSPNVFNWQSMLVLKDDHTSKWYLLGMAKISWTQTSSICSRHCQKTAFVASQEVGRIDRCQEKAFPETSIPI